MSTRLAALAKASVNARGFKKIMASGGGGAKRNRTLLDFNRPYHGCRSKIFAHYAEDEHFPPPIPRSLLSAAPCDIVIDHGRGRSLGPRSNFALPRVVQSVSVHHLPHPPSELSPCSIVLIN